MIVDDNLIEIIYMLEKKNDEISRLTADATAALAARDKATREHAMRDAATQIDREIASDPGDWGSEFIAGLDRAKSVLK